MERKEFSEAVDRLTPQQKKVLSRVLANEADSAIAQDLDIQPSTVRKHVERIYRVFNLTGEFSDDRRSRRNDLLKLISKYNPDIVSEDNALTIKEKIDNWSLPANPFIPLTGRVVDRRYFFNREQEIRRTFDLLNSGSSVALIGENGIGKSSLLYTICQQAKNQLHYSRHPVYLNLQPLQNEDDFYSDLCNQAKIGEPDQPIRGYQLVRELRKRPLLLGLDEVENQMVFTAKVRSQLRGLAEGSDADAPLRLVLAASKSLDLLFQDEGMTSPLANICIEEKLDVWDEATSRAFIAERLASTSVTFNDEEITHIIAESGGHPQKLMQQCHRTYARYMEGMQ
ncbi:MAG: AAA family ATPase [Phormidium sp.]